MSSYKKLESGEQVCDDCNKNFLKQMHFRKCHHVACDACISKPCTNCLYPNNCKRESLSEIGRFDEMSLNKLEIQRLGKTLFLVFILKTALPFSTIEREEKFKRFMSLNNLLGNLLVLSYQNNEWLRSKIPDSNMMLNAGLEYYLCRARYPSKKYIEDILDGPTTQCKCNIV